MIEDQLREALTDERWDLPVRPGLLADVRRGRAAHRRRTATATALAGLAVVAGTVGVVQLLPDRNDQLGTFAAGGVPEGSPAPGITPAWVPEHGRDWLLTAEEERAFYATHTRPSPAPGQSVVESPAPLGPQSEALLADVQAAGLPDGTQMRREDAAGGQPNSPAVHLTLPDGTPVEVLRSWAQGPMGFRWQDGLDHSGTKVEDVPGTLSAGVAYDQFGYGFRGYGIDSVGVITVSRGGEWTTWAAPSVVPLEDLEHWAFAAAQHDGG